MTAKEQVTFATTIALIVSQKPFRDISDEEIRETAELYSRVEKVLGEEQKHIQIPPGIKFPEKSPLVPPKT